MARLVTAVRFNDTGGILACFSKRKPNWFFAHGRKRPYTYESVEKGLAPGGGFHSFFFDEDGPFAQEIEENSTWPHVGTLFVPPGYEKQLDLMPTGVRWRKEGNGYVIDSLYDNGD
jgi:hypothetical protein